MALSTNRKRLQFDEKYYLMLIDKGDLDSMNNLTLYYQESEKIK